IPARVPDNRDRIASCTSTNSGVLVQCANDCEIFLCGGKFAGPIVRYQGIRKDSSQTLRTTFTGGEFPRTFRQLTTSGQITRQYGSYCPVCHSRGELCKLAAPFSQCRGMLDRVDGLRSSITSRYLKTSV